MSDDSFDDTQIAANEVLADFVNIEMLSIGFSKEEIVKALAHVFISLKKIHIGT